MSADDRSRISPPRRVSRTPSALVDWYKRAAEDDPFRRTGDEWLGTLPREEQRAEWRRRIEEDLRDPSLNAFTRRQLKGLLKTGWPPEYDGAGV